MAVPLIKPLVLASQSPRRQELLAQLGYAFTVQPADIDETPISGELPAAYVRRMAAEKAMAIASGLEQDCLVLGSDTAVIVDEDILGKPVSRADAVVMLQRLAGREHQVLSSACLVDVASAACTEALSLNTIRFAPLSLADIEAYLDCGESMDKAGSYAIQGRAASFVEHLEGSYSGVMGLPLYETAQLLKPWADNRLGAER